MASIDFTDQWERADIKLIVMEHEEEDGKTLYANQGVLAIWSPVFAAMFKDGSFKEGTTNEVKLRGKDYDDVLELLKVLHPPNSPVTLRNAYQLLLPGENRYFPLADITRGVDYATLSEASKHYLLCKRISTIEAQIPKSDRLHQASIGCRPIHCDQHYSNKPTCQACSAIRSRAFYESLFKPSK